MIFFGAFAYVFFSTSDALGTLAPQATPAGVAEGLGVLVGEDDGFFSGVFSRKAYPAKPSPPRATASATEIARRRWRRWRVRARRRRSASLASCRSRVLLLLCGMFERRSLSAASPFDHAIGDAVQEVRL